MPLEPSGYCIYQSLLPRQAGQRDRDSNDFWQPWRGRHPPHAAEVDP